MSSANIGARQVKKKVLQNDVQKKQQDEEPNWDFKGLDHYVISNGNTSNPFSTSVEIPSAAYRSRLPSNRRQQCSISELGIAVSGNPGRCRSRRKKIQMHKINNKVPHCPVMECAKEVQANLDAQFPSFIKLMLQSHVTRGFWLGLPAEFCKMHLPSNDEMVILEDESGEEYETRFLAIKRGLSGGWYGFSQAHKLLEGDAVVFHLVRSCKFKVYIVRSSSLGEVDGAITLLNLQNHATGRDCGMGLNNMLRKKEKGGAPKAIEQKKKSAAKTVGKTAKRGVPSVTKIVEWQPRRKSQRVAVVVDDEQAEKAGASGFELVHFDKQGKFGNNTGSLVPNTVLCFDKYMTTKKEVPEKDKLVDQWAGKLCPDWELDNNARAQYISHANKFIGSAAFLRDQEFSGQCSDLEMDKQLYCSFLQTMVFGQELLDREASSLKSIQDVEEQLVKLSDRVVELESQIEKMQKAEEQMRMELKDKADDIEKASSEGANTAKKLKEVCWKMKRYGEHFQAVQASFKKNETGDGLLSPSFVKDLSLRLLKTPSFKRIVKDILNPCYNAGFAMAVDRMMKSNPVFKPSGDILQEYYKPSATNTKVPWKKGYIVPKDCADDDFEEEEEDEVGEDGSACHDGLIAGDIGPSVDESATAQETCAQSSINIYEGAPAQGQNELPPAAISSPSDLVTQHSNIVNPTGDGESN